MSETADASKWHYEALTEIEKAKGANGKTSRLIELEVEAQEQFGNSDVFSSILRYAYDEGILFGISRNHLSVISTRTPNPEPFGLWVFMILDQVRITSGTTQKVALIDEAMGKLSMEGQHLLARIIDKDLRCGISKTTINKAFKGFFESFDVMLAKPFEARRVTWPVAVEPKLDGLRVVAVVDLTNREVKFLTRSGKDITSLSKFEEETITFAYQFAEHGFVTFDGEVTSGTFAESMSSVRSKSEQAEEATYHVFDVLVSKMRPALTMSDVELEEQGDYLKRRDRLMTGFVELTKHIESPAFIKPTWSYTVSSEDEVISLYERCRDAGLEGVLVKNRSSFYTKKRSIAWMKIKAEETADLPIIGAFEGEGQFAGSLGGLIVSHNGVEVKVGSGFSAEQRAEFWDQFLKDLEHIEAGRREKCLLIDATAEIQYQEILPSGSLRHPVFVRLRHDKDVRVGAF